MIPKSDRFEIVSRQSLGLSGATYILKDKATGVLYLYFGSGYGGGLTPIIDQDGKPVVDAP